MPKSSLSFEERIEKLEQEIADLKIQLEDRERAWQEAKSSTSAETPPPQRNKYIDRHR